MIAQSTAGIVDTQVIAGLIVGVVLLVGGWLIRRIVRSVGDDIKQSVITTLTQVIDEKVTEKTSPILDQFYRNGGSTLKDGMDRLEKGQQTQAGELAQVKDMTTAQGKVLGEHIAFHKGQESKTVANKAVPRKAVAR